MGESFKDLQQVFADTPHRDLKICCKVQWLCEKMLRTLAFTIKCLKWCSDSSDTYKTWRFQHKMWKCMLTQTCMLVGKCVYYFKVKSTENIIFCQCKKLFLIFHLNLIWYITSNYVFFFQFEAFKCFYHSILTTKQLSSSFALKKKDLQNELPWLIAMKE